MQNGARRHSALAADAPSVHDAAMRRDHDCAGEQAFGESLDPDKLARLGRYEVHLDRKLERTLAMLLRLKDLRQGAIAG